MGKNFCTERRLPVLLILLILLIWGAILLISFPSAALAKPSLSTTLTSPPRWETSRFSFQARSASRHARRVANAVSRRGVQLLELRIPCEVGAEVQAILPNDEIINLGRVLMTPVKTNWPAYTASKWCENATVCASAVNAVHMLVNVEKNEKSENRGRILSLVPAVTLAPAAVQGSFFALDMPAGTGIFGGFAPFVGSKVFIKDGEGVERKLDGVPKRGEVLIIRSDLPKKPEFQEFYMVDIENRVGGRVIMHGRGGIKVIARVIRPVRGVGRFGGTQFQDIGRIRASHAGVIDIATSRRGEVGGIQIMPLIHALTSPEMINAWRLTQWMIIAPLPHHKMLAGSEPLFKHSFIPGAQLSDKSKIKKSKLKLNAYGRPLILCREGGGAWSKLPDVSGRVDDAFKNITHLRLYFPFSFF